MNKLPPPVIMFVGIFIEWALHHYAPISTIYSLQYVGYAFIVAAIIILLASLKQFATIKTEIVPHKEPNKMVTNWPYSMTRNPMYLGLEFMLIGFAAYYGSYSSFLVPVLFTILVTKVYIKMEEMNMTKKFGKEYKDYTSTVRRWI